MTKAWKMMRVAANLSIRFIFVSYLSIFSALRRTSRILDMPARAIQLARESAF